MYHFERVVVNEIITVYRLISGKADYLLRAWDGENIDNASVYKMNH